MVNPGHPSKGCGTCKLRRIRCDETRPTCLKCASLKRMCLGYDGQKSTDSCCSKKQLRADVQEPGSIRLKAGYRNLTQHANSVQTDVHHKLLVGFAFNIRRGSLDTSLSQQLGLAQVDSADHTIRCMVKAMETSFQSLQEPAHTFEIRRKMHEKYQFAMHNLRSMILSTRGPQASYVLAYMFALYEMTVNLDPDDRTWTVHLDGFLAILCQQQVECSEAWISTLIHASQILKRGDGIHASLAGRAMDDLRTAFLLMDITKLRLRQLTSEMRKLLGGLERPRKLDVQKLRVSLKQVHGDILLIPSKLRLFSSDSASALQNEYRTIVIVAASLMIDSGIFIQSNESYNATREYAKLSRSIKEAVDGICASFAHLLSDKAESTASIMEVTKSSGALTIDALLAMWPLFSASVARGISTTQRWRIRAALWRIGETARIPKAMSLATSEEDGTRYPDILAGLILVRAGLFRSS